MKPDPLTPVEAPPLQPGDFYAVAFETLGGATVAFVGKHLRTNDFGHAFEDDRTKNDVVVPHARALSCVLVDGPWLSPREVRAMGAH